MLHNLDRGMQVHSLGLSNYIRKILEHQTARSIRPLALEFREIVAHAATDIDKEDIILCDIGEHAWHVIETDIHPARTSLVIARHVIVELASSIWVLLHKLEEVKVGSESTLESTLLAIGWVEISVFLKLGRKSEDAGGDAVCPGK